MDEQMTVNNQCFTSMVKTSLTMANGQQTTMITLVPNGIHFEAAVLGINQTVKASGNIATVEHEVFRTRNSVIERSAHYLPKQVI